MEPIQGRGDGTSVAREIDNNGVAALYLGVLDEMIQETLVDVVFGRIFVQENTELVFGNFQVLQKPTLNIFGVLDARFQIPQGAGLILVNTNKEGEKWDRGRLKYQLS